MIRQYIDKIIVAAVFICIVAMLLFIPKDPDLFWHLKYGQLSLENGPFTENLFSHTLTEFQFYNFEFMAQIIMFLLYKIGGFFLLNIFFAVLVYASLKLAVKNPLAKKLSKKNRLIALLVGLITIFPIIGARTQMFSMFFFSLTFFLLETSLKKNRKLLFVVPIVIWFWANTHAGFLSGIILIGIYFSSFFIKSVHNFLSEGKKVDKVNLDLVKKLFFVLIISIFSTLVTPFSYHLLLEVIEFSFDRYAYKHIAEWLPVNFQSFYGKIIISYLILQIYSFTKKKSQLREYLLFIFFALLSLQNRRHVALFVMLSLYQLTYFRLPEQLKIFTKEIFTSFLYKLLVVTFFIISLLLLTVRTNSFYQLNSDKLKLYKHLEYPIEAVEFLRDKDYKGHIYNSYGWGGFMILEYPEKKTFIDGRMTSWTIGDTRILEEYIGISELSDPEWRETLNEYGVQIILDKPDSQLINVIQFDQTWTKVYEDEISVVYIKAATSED